MKQGSIVFNQQYRRLNTEQRLAVDTIDGPLIVLAGPGTGKTQVVAMRVANILLKTNLDPYNILCLTFTDAAAAHMRHRLVTIIGEAAYYVRIQTFHSFCNDVIQAHREHFAVARDLRVLSEVERVQLFKKIVDDLPAASPLKPFGHPYLYLADLIGTIRTLKQENLSPAAYAAILAEAVAFGQNVADPLETFFYLSPTDRTAAHCEAIRTLLLEHCRGADPVAKTLQSHLVRIFTQYDEALRQAQGKREESMIRTKLKNGLKSWFTKLQKYQPQQADIKRIYEAYQAQLKKRGRYDYEDMITLVVDAFAHDDALLAHYQELLQYILVDEFQDTNGAQNEVIRLLGSWHEAPNIFVVGDDKQSIFRFQGASLETIVRFYELHKKFARVILLTSNYRSPQSILDAADTVIRHNDQSSARYIPGSEQALIAAARRGRPPIAEHVFFSEMSEDYWVAKTVQALIAAGTPPQEIAVLYRYHTDVEGLTPVLAALQVPWRQDGGQDIFKQRRIQHVLTVLQYVHDTTRHELLFELLHGDFFKLPPVDVLKVTHWASRRGESLLEVMATPKKLAAAGIKKKAPWLALVEKIARWRRLGTTEALPNFLALILEESGLLESIISDPARMQLLNHVITFYDEVKKLAQEEPAITLGDLLAHLTTLREHGIKLETEMSVSPSGAVRLMTAHRAKGLEFDHVFIIRLTDGHWGNLPDRHGLPLPPGVAGFDHLQRTANEDERRLFYVAMTRAKKQLYVSYAQRAPNGREQIPSLFLTEVPAAAKKTTVHHETDDALVERMKAIVAPRVAPATSASLRAWLSSRLDRYAFSVTALNNYLECPKLFYYRNVLRVPVPRSKQVSLGTAVHQALHDFFVEWKPGAALPPVGYLLERFGYYVSQEIMSDVDRRDSLRVGRAALRGYYYHYCPHLRPTNLLEYNFGPHRVQIDDLRLTGKIDKIELLDPDTKTVNIVDYKTGNPDTGIKKLSPHGPYRRQLVFYKLLTQLSRRFPYTFASGEIDFIQPSPTTGKYIKKKLEITDKDVTALKETIQQSWKEIKKLQFLKPDNPAFCGKCEYCVK